MAIKLGGKREGAGRKPLLAGQDTVTISLCCTTAQRDKLKLLGGAAWMRGQIEAARVGAPIQVADEVPDMTFDHPALAHRV